MSTQGTKRRAIIGSSLALIALYVALLLPWRSSSRTAVPGPSPAPAAEPAAHVAAAPGALVRAPSAPSQPKPEDPAARLESLAVVAAPLIGEVMVEKTTVCRGEDFKLSIKPLPGEEAALFNVEGQFGQELVLSASLPHEERFWIVASNGMKRDFRDVNVRVLPDDDPRCASQPAATIHVKPGELGSDIVGFEAAPLRGLGAIKSVSWSFGDGATEYGGAVARHDYSRRPQTSEATSFIVTADLVDEAGIRARARASVPLMNLHYQVRSLTGERPIPVSYGRFPIAKGRFSASLTNIEDKPVRFERARVRLRSCTLDDQERELTVPASDVLGGAAYLAPGQTIDAQLALAPEWLDAETCRIELSLLGDTDPPTRGQAVGANGLPGRDVSADLTLDIGFPKTVEEGGDPEYASEPVTDPELQAKLLALMAEKDRNYLTEEELNEAAP